jgi:hypothetical protein
LAFTDTPLPSETATASPTGVGFFLPAARSDMVSIYFILLNPDPSVCNDRVIAVSSGEPITGNIARDVAAGLRKLFSYRQKVYGDLYNPQGASRFRVEEVDFEKDTGLIDVFISGSYNRPEDPCENTRVKAQIWSTIKQFPQVTKTNIFLDRVPFGDLLSND